MVGLAHSHSSTEWVRALPPAARSSVIAYQQAKGLEEGAQRTEQPAKSKEEIQHQKDIQRDIDEGKEYTVVVEKELKLSKNEDMNVRLQAIAGEMAEVANETPVTVMWGDRRFNKFQYTFKLVEGEDVNAFSLPGGYIYVYEGLMNFAESDDELASVMAHEISHASFRHMATLRKEQSKLDLFNIPIMVAAVLSRSSDAMKVAMASQMATQGLSSGWSVQAETAADFGAIQYLQKSRYNPIGMLTFMERLAHRDQLAPQFDWGIYQTHPPSEERVRFLTKMLNEAGIPIKRSQVTKTFSARSVPVEGTFELWFGKDKLHTFRGPTAKDRAARAVLRLNDFFDTVPQMYQFQTSGEDLLGNGRVLFTVEAGDLDASTPLPNAVETAAKAIRTALFDLNYRLGK